MRKIILLSVLLFISAFYHSSASAANGYCLGDLGQCPPSTSQRIFSTVDQTGTYFCGVVNGGGPNSQYNWSVQTSSTTWNVVCGPTGQNWTSSSVYYRTDAADCPSNQIRSTTTGLCVAAPVTCTSTQYLNSQNQCESLPACTKFTGALGTNYLCSTVSAGCLDTFQGETDVITGMDVCDTNDTAQATVFSQAQKDAAEPLAAQADDAKDIANTAAAAKEQSAAAAQAAADAAAAELAAAQTTEQQTTAAAAYAAALQSLQSLQALAANSIAAAAAAVQHAANAVAGAASIQPGYSSPQQSIDGYNQALQGKQGAELERDKALSGSGDSGTGTGTNPNCTVQGNCTDGLATEGTLQGIGDTLDQLAGEGAGEGSYSELPEALYESQYPDGIEGIWNDHTAALNQTAMFQAVAVLTPNLGDGGSIPEFSLDVLSFGTFTIPVNPDIWPFIRLIIIITALFTARSIIFGG